MELRLSCDIHMYIYKHVHVHLYTQLHVQAHEHACTYAEIIYYRIFV